MSRGSNRVRPRVQLDGVGASCSPGFDLSCIWIEKQRDDDAGILQATDSGGNAFPRTDHIQAAYERGVLTLRIPVAERAKPRTIAIATEGAGREAIDA